MLKRIVPARYGNLTLVLLAALLTCAWSTMATADGDTPGHDRREHREAEHAEGDEKEVYRKDDDQRRGRRLLAAWGKDGGDDEHDEDEEEHEEHEEDWDEDEWEEEEHELEWFLAEIEIYQSLMELVFTLTEVSGSAETAGVAAVLAVEEHAEEPEDMAAFFNDVLPNVSSPVIERAVRLKLIDVYAEMDDRERVLEQLRILITAPAE